VYRDAAQGEINMTFQERLLTVKLVLGTAATGTTSGQSGTFTGPNGADGNTVTLTGLRVWASMNAAGQMQNTTAQITIFGMTEDQMNAASTYAAWPALIKDAQVFLYAGDPSSGGPLIFAGSIVRAVADYNAQPDVAFHIEARSGLSAQMTILPPTSVKGTVNAAALLQALAGQVSPALAFENNSNVQVQLSNPHFKGSAMDQIRAICAAAQINYYIENNTTLAIWPKGQARATGSQTVTLSPKDGSLVGYPIFGQNDLAARCVFNPAIRYGATVMIQDSIVKSANGTWCMYAIEHELQAMTPGGAWFSTLRMVPPASLVAN
jgi:Baseplate hub gp41